MPPSSQPVITPHMHRHRNRMIATAFVLVLILALVLFLASVARRNQRNAAFEKWYAEYEGAMAEENLKKFATQYNETSQLSPAEASAQAQANLELFKKALSSEAVTSGESTQQETEQVLQDFGQRMQEEKEALRRWYFEKNN